MTNTVYNTTKHDYAQNPMFFGKDLGVYREDQLKYPVLLELAEIQRGLTWQPQDTNLTQDKVDYEIKLDFIQRFIYDENLKYQTTLDTVQARAINLVLAPHVSLPEVESFMLWWAAFEDLHSTSYQYMLKQVYANPTPIIDDIYENISINSRMDTMVTYYDKLLNTTDEKREKNLLMLLYSINALEAIRFYVSFVCTFAFDRANLMRGSSKIVGYIARDESVHYKAVTFIINQLQNGNEGKKWRALCEETKQDAVAIFNQVLSEEMDWIDHLFKYGEPDFLSKELLQEKLKWYTAKTMKNLSLPIEFDYPKQNPMRWVEDTYLNFSSVQNANQDQNSIAYMSDITIDNLNEDKLAAFSKFLNGADLSVDEKSYLTSLT